MNPFQTDSSIQLNDPGLTRVDEADSKAFLWLLNQQTTCNLEALVYLACQRVELKDSLPEVRRRWKLAEKETINQYNNENAARLTIHDIASAADLSNFWSGAEGQQNTIDATMLRTMDWLGIAGFEHWWERLARQTHDEVLGDCFARAARSVWLFAMCRSDYAVQNMRASLTRALDSLTLDSDGLPWQHIFRAGTSITISENIRYVSAIVFAEYRLQQTSGLMGKAIATLQNANENGFWPIWTHASEPSIETTAMAMHAMAMTQPRGWEGALAEASNWLADSSNAEGYWTEPGTDPVYLTVLVMDALSLARKLPRQTFRIQSSVSALTKTAFGSSEQLSAPAPAVDSPPAVGTNAGEDLARLRTALSPKQWQDIEIRFTGDESVQIFCGNRSEVRNYTELGFEDGRNENPNQLWITLRMFAKQGGSISCVGDAKAWSKLEKDVQKIRPILRDYFRISDDPIPYVRAAQSYRPRFKVTRAASFGDDDH